MFYTRKYSAHAYFAGWRVGQLDNSSIQKKNNVYKMYLNVYILTLIVTLTEGFYLPGLAPVVYCEKSGNIDKCQVKMPFYTVQLPFWLLCQPFTDSGSRDVHSSQIPLDLSQFILYSVLFPLPNARFQKTLHRMWKYAPHKGIILILILVIGLALHQVKSGKGAQPQTTLGTWVRNISRI